MGATFCQRKILLFFIAVATILQGCSSCDDGSGLAKVCHINRPCGITNDGAVVLADNFKDHDIYKTGACHFGIIECDPEDREICVGFVSPAEEICDDLDNDCDGEVDEGFDFDNDGYTSCGGDCDDLRKSVNPTATEVCDGRDNDCNDEIDEALAPLSCWRGPTLAVFGGDSICQQGQQFCIDGSWGPCNNQTLPTAETCNEIDDECNGTIDDIRRTTCGPSQAVGICAFGRVLCDGGESKCIDAIYPEAETCDGADNDCDCAVDEGLIRRCASACGSGVEECSSGAWVNCDAVQPTAELCDMIDNDCDCVVD